MNTEEFKRQCEVAEGYLSLGILDEAWNTLEELPAEFKVTKEVLTLQMGVLLKSGEYLKASFLAETLCRFDPDDSDRLIYVARYRYEGRQFESALAWLKSVEEKCDHDAYFHYLRAQCLSSLGNTDEAKAELTKAISMNEGFKLRANEDPAFEFLFGAEPR
jgi:tetratricopeptide (TPR) repeat protein